jgi:hypothetical protein
MHLHHRWARTIHHCVRLCSPDAFSQLYLLLSVSQTTIKTPELSVKQIDTMSSTSLLTILTEKTVEDRYRDQHRVYAGPPNAFPILALIFSNSRTQLIIHIQISRPLLTFYPIYTLTPDYPTTYLRGSSALPPNTSSPSPSRSRNSINATSPYVLYSHTSPPFSSPCAHE